MLAYMLSVIASTYVHMLAAWFLSTVEAPFRYLDAVVFERFKRLWQSLRKHTGASWLTDAIDLNNASTTLTKGLNQRDY